MIVCDECKDVTKQAFDCSIIVEKQDPPKKTETPGRIVKKPLPREVVKIPVVLCEECITKACRSLGHMKQKGLLTRWQEKPAGTEQKPAATYPNCHILNDFLSSHWALGFCSSVGAIPKSIKGPYPNRDLAQAELAKLNQDIGDPLGQSWPHWMLADVEQWRLLLQRADDTVAPLCTCDNEDIRVTPEGKLAHHNTCPLFPKHTEAPAHDDY